MRLLLLLAACTAHNPAYNGAADGGACDPNNLAGDPHHCGNCANDCAALPNVDGSKVQCLVGNCVVANACLPGFADCNGAPGCETDLGDPAHCGSCTQVCGGATPLCAGTCVATCPANLPTRCGNRCVSTVNDPAHCGSCDPCPLPQHGHATCAASVCDITCDAGFHVCGDLCLANASPQSCGSSCTPCAPPANASPTCNGGVCDFVCDANFTRMGDTCVPNGGGCTSVTCTNGLVCADGVCCGPPNGFCSANSDCCSGRCTAAGFGTCDCTPSGNSCNKDGDCCLLRCQNGKCACNPVGGSCADNSDCCGGNCDTVNGVCACAGVGGACKVGTDCCSGICGAGGTCQCRATGTCTGDGDCCSGRCDNGSCANCTAIGGACVSGGTCCTQSCNVTCQCLPRGTACTRDGDCCSNDCFNGFCSCAAPPSQVATDKCTRADDCCWGTCSGGTCFCKAENDSCLDSSECCDGLQCTGNHCTVCLTGGNCTTNVGQTQCCTLRQDTCPGVSALCCGLTGAVCFSDGDCCTAHTCGHDNRCS